MHLLYIYRDVFGSLAHHFFVNLTTHLVGRLACYFTLFKSNVIFHRIYTNVYPPTKASLKVSHPTRPPVRPPTHFLPPFLPRLVNRRVDGFCILVMSHMGRERGGTQ